MVVASVMSSSCNSFSYAIFPFFVYQLAVVATMYMGRKRKSYQMKEKKKTCC